MTPSLEEEKGGQAAAVGSRSSEWQGEQLADQIEQTSAQLVSCPCIRTMQISPSCCIGLGAQGGWIKERTWMVANQQRKIEKKQDLKRHDCVLKHADMYAHCN